MNRSQLEHIIRAASQISGDREIVVVGSQSIHGQSLCLPPVAFMSAEADVYPMNRPDMADAIDGAIGELSGFHESFGYYAQGVSEETAVLPSGWKDRLVPLMNENTGGAVGLCLNVHDLLLAKYAANREKDREFNRAVIAYDCVDRMTLLILVEQMPVEDATKSRIKAAIESDFDTVLSLSEGRHSTSRIMPVDGAEVIARDPAECLDEEVYRSIPALNELANSAAKVGNMLSQDGREALFFESAKDSELRSLTVEGAMVSRHDMETAQPDMEWMNGIQPATRKSFETPNSDDWIPTPGGAG